MNSSTIQSLLSQYCEQKWNLSAEKSALYASAMDEALALGESVRATTSPNPPVGCAILNSRGVILGRGATSPPGGNHAEINALESYKKFSGADDPAHTAVVTLEPCHHWGRTGPCSHALLEAGIQRLVYLFADPNGQASGGADFLRSQGIEVIGPLMTDCDKSYLPPLSIEPWVRSTVLSRPVITMKCAQTLNGYIAAPDQSSQWITGEAARNQVHYDRSLRDGIIVGTGTIWSDYPQLTARHKDGSLYEQQPQRIVMGARSLPQGYDEEHGWWHLQSHDLRENLDYLYQRGMVDLLVEGGSQLSGAFLREGLVDFIQCYQAPALLGAGHSAIAGLPAQSMKDIMRFIPRRLSQYGEDIMWELSTPFPRRKEER